MRELTLQEIEEVAGGWNFGAFGASIIGGAIAGSSGGCWGAALGALGGAVAYAGAELAAAFSCLSIDDQLWVHDATMYSMCGVS